MSTGEQIRKLRRIKELSQAELAKIIGVSRSAVYDWERGAYLPSDEKLGKLAIALDTTVSNLKCVTNELSHKIDSATELQEARTTEKQSYIQISEAYESIIKLAKMQELSRKYYKYYREPEMSILGSELKDYKDLINNIRALQPWNGLYLLAEADDYARHANNPESKEKPDVWDIRDTDERAEKRRKAGRYADPQMGIFEIIIDIARLQEKAHRSYKLYKEHEVIVLSVLLDAYIDLVNKIRELQPWKELNGNDEEKH